MKTRFHITHQYAKEPKTFDRYLETSRPVPDAIQVFLYLHDLGEKMPEALKQSETINPCEIEKAAIELFGFEKSSELQDFNFIFFDIYDEIEGGYTAVEYTPKSLLPTSEHEEVMLKIYQHFRSSESVGTGETIEPGFRDEAREAERHRLIAKKVNDHNEAYRNESK